MQALNQPTIEDYWRKELMSIILNELNYKPKDREFAQKKLSSWFDRYYRKLNANSILRTKLSDIASKQSSSEPFIITNKDFLLTMLTIEVLIRKFAAEQEPCGPPKILNRRFMTSLLHCIQRIHIKVMHHDF